MKLKENLETKSTTPMKSQSELFIIKLSAKELPVSELSSLTSWTLSPTCDKVTCEEGGTFLLNFLSIYGKLGT